MTLANYLDPQNLTLPFMMKGSAKRLKRALGLFPLAIKRRNKKWYQLGARGAAYFQS